MLVAARRRFEQVVGRVVQVVGAVAVLLVAALPVGRGVLRAEDLLVIPAEEVGVFGLLVELLGEEHLLLDRVERQGLPVEPIENDHVGRERPGNVLLAVVKARRSHEEGLALGVGELRPVRPVPFDIEIVRIPGSCALSLPE